MYPYEVACWLGRWVTSNNPPHMLVVRLDNNSTTCLWGQVCHAAYAHWPWSFQPTMVFSFWHSNSPHTCWWWDQSTTPTSRVELWTHFTIVALTRRIDPATRSLVDARGNFALPNNFELLDNFAWDNSLHFYLRNEWVYIKAMSSYPSTTTLHMILKQSLLFKKCNAIFIIVHLIFYQQISNW